MQTVAKFSYRTSMSKGPLLLLLLVLQNKRTHTRPYIISSSRRRSSPRTAHTGMVYVCEWNMKRRPRRRPHSGKWRHIRQRTGNGPLLRRLQSVGRCRCHCSPHWTPPTTRSNHETILSTCVHLISWLGQLLAP